MQPAHTKQRGFQSHKPAKKKPENSQTTGRDTTTTDTNIQSRIRPQIVSKVLQNRIQPSKHKGSPFTFSSGLDLGLLGFVLEILG